jgi:hypothetical protein
MVMALSLMLPERTSFPALDRDHATIRRAAKAIACKARRAHGGPMVAPSPLDDPNNAAHAWARFRRLMKGMAALTLTVSTAAMIYLYETEGMVSIHYFIAAFLGISVMMMLMAALMGLSFLSSGTGHDEAVEDPLDKDHDW